MRKRSKILAIILSVAMVGSMWSPVFAEETTEVVTEAAADEVAEEEAVEPVEEAAEAEAVEEEAPVEEAATPDEVVIENAEETVAPAEEAAEVVEADPVDGDAYTFETLWFKDGSVTADGKIEVYIKYVGETSSDGKLYDVNSKDITDDMTPSNVLRYVDTVAPDKTIPITCEKGAGYHYTVTYNEKSYQYDYTGEKGTGHDWTGADDVVTLQAADHQSAGVLVYYKTCKNCGKRATANDYVDGSPATSTTGTNGQFTSVTLEGSGNDGRASETEIENFMGKLGYKDSTNGSTIPYKAEKIEPSHNYTTEVYLPVKIENGVYKLCVVEAKAREAATGGTTEAESIEALEGACNLEITTQTVNEKTIYVVDMASGSPKLVDPQESGYYVKTKLCSLYGETSDGWNTANWATGIQCYDNNDNATSKLILATGVYSEVAATQLGSVLSAYITAANNIDLINGKTVSALTAKKDSSTDVKAEVTKNGEFAAYDESKIVMTDCSKTGSYTVELTTKTTKGIEKTYEREVIVSAHHSDTTVVEFAKGAATVTWSNGVPTVTATSCEKEVSYDVITVCQSSKCSGTKKYSVDTKNEAHYAGSDRDAVWSSSTTAKELSRTTSSVPASGTHHTDKAALESVISAKNGATELTYDEICSKLDSNTALKADLDAGIIKLTPSTDDCTKAGTLSIEYTCKVCKQVVETETVNYAAEQPGDGSASQNDTDGHKWNTTTTILESKPATCTEEGSVTTVIKCTHTGCAQVKNKTTSTTKKLAHTNAAPEDAKKQERYLKLDGNVVIDVTKGENSLANVAIGTDITEQFATIGETDSNTTNPNLKGDASAYIYTLCTTCGGNAEELETDKLKVKLVSLEKEGKDCQPGSITVAVSYSDSYNDVNGKLQKVELSGEKTFQYYSSELAYQGRTAHTAGETKKENVVEPTETENGSYDLVTYCQICGTAMKTEHVTVAATGVKLPAVQNLKAETKGMNRVKLTWDKLDGAIGYIVLGLNETGRYGNQIAYTTQTSWTDTAADSEAYNFYWVVGVSKNAENKNVVGELGSYVYAIGRVVGATTNLAAKTASNGVTLTWTKASNANGYVILSRKGRTGKANKLTSVGDVASYTDTTADGTTFYWVYGTYTNEEGKTVVAGATSNYAYATK